jgi:hypothetical protein
LRAWQWLLSAFEKVSVLLKAPQVRLEQAKCSFGIPRIDARSPQTDYAAFLLLYDAPPFGDELLGAAKIVFGTHLSNNTQTAKQAQDQESAACRRRGRLKKMAGTAT